MSSKSKGKAPERTEGATSDEGAVTELVPGTGPIEPGAIDDPEAYARALAEGKIEEFPASRTELLALAAELRAEHEAALAQLRSDHGAAIRELRTDLFAELAERLADAPGVPELERREAAAGVAERRPIRGRTDGRRRHHVGAYTFGREWRSYDVTEAEFRELRRDPCIKVELID